jgi:hypothetical protein
VAGERHGRGMLCVNRRLIYHCNRDVRITRAGYLTAAFSHFYMRTAIYLFFVIYLLILFFSIRQIQQFAFLQQIGVLSVEIT